MRLYFPVLPGVRASVNLGGRSRRRTPKRSGPGLLDLLERRKDEKEAEARRRLRQTTLDLTKLAESVETTSPEQAKGIAGWSTQLALNAKRLLQGDESAAKPYEEATTALSQWIAWRSAKCDHCGAPDQTAGQPCRYCAKAV